MKRLIILLSIFLFSLPMHPTLAAVDNSNYLNEIPKRIVWENPKSITVYIPNVEKKLILQKAFEYWDKQLGATVNFVFALSPKHVNIYCTYVNATKNSIVGVTYNTYNKNLRKHMTDAKVYVAMKDSSGRNFNDDELYSIALHEIGHALGIHGHSSSKDDIMYYSTSGNLYGKGTISKKDVNTVKMLYGVNLR